MDEAPSTLALSLALYLRRAPPPAPHLHPPLRLPHPLIAHALSISSLTIFVHISLRRPVLPLFPPIPTPSAPSPSFSSLHPPFEGRVFSSLPAFPPSSIPPLFALQMLGELSAI